MQCTDCLLARFSLEQLHQVQHNARWHKWRRDAPHGLAGQCGQQAKVAQNGQAVVTSLLRVS